MKYLFLILFSLICFCGARGQVVPHAGDYWIIRNPDGVMCDFREPSPTGGWGRYGWKLGFGNRCGVERLGIYRWIGQIGDSVLVRYEKDAELRDSLVYKVNYYDCACGFGTLFFMKKTEWDNRLLESALLRARHSLEKHLEAAREEEESNRLQREKDLVLKILGGKK